MVFDFEHFRTFFFQEKLVTENIEKFRNAEGLINWSRAFRLT